MAAWRPRRGRHGGMVRLQEARHARDRVPGFHVSIRRRSPLPSGAPNDVNQALLDEIGIDSCIGCVADQQRAEQAPKVLPARVFVPQR